MIKINLLPFRLARKKENIRRQISIFLLMIVLTCVGLYWYTVRVDNQIESIKSQTQQINTQIAKYKEKANRVSKIKKDLKTLNEKLEIVASLKAKRDQQLVLFDSMTQLIVPQRMWIESMSTNPQSVTVKGIAFDNHTIADFMKKLEASPLFNKVDLKRAQSKKYKNGEMLKSFELFCIKNQAVTQEEKKSEKGKK
jgi:type IV pilus assembly protein PilN